MQWIPCSVAQWISIERSVFHAVRPNESQLNAVDSMQHGAMDVYRMQWFPCNVAQWIPIDCSGFHAASLDAVDSMQHGEMHPN